MQNFAKGTPMFVGSSKAAKIAEYLQELQGYKDTTKLKKMTNEQKAKEIAGYKPDEKPDEIPMYQAQDGDKYICYVSAMAMAQWKDAQHRTPSDDTTEDFVHHVIGEICCNETDLQRKIERGKAFADHNKTVFDVAMAVAASYQAYAESQRDVIKELGKENDKLRFSFSERETEIERLKDEHKNEMDEYRAVYFHQNNILVEQNNALKRQLDESNRQIEIYAKKVRNLEAELEEGGFFDERNFI